MDDAARSKSLPVFMVIATYETRSEVDGFEIQEFCEYEGNEGYIAMMEKYKIECANGVFEDNAFSSLINVRIERK